MATNSITCLAWKSFDTEPIRYHVGMGTLLELDGRGRVAIGKLAGGTERYLAEVENDGTIVLTPAVVLSEAEVKLLSRVDILQTVSANRDAGRPKARHPVRHR